MGDINNKLFPPEMTSKEKREIAHYRRKIKVLGLTQQEKNHFVNLMAKDIVEHYGKTMEKKNKLI